MLSTGEHNCLAIFHRTLPMVSLLWACMMKSNTACEEGLGTRCCSRSWEHSRDPTDKNPHQGGSPSTVIQCPFSHPRPRHLSRIKSQVLLLRSAQALPFSPRPTTSYPACHRTTTQVPRQGLCSCRSLCLQCSSPEMACCHFISSLLKCRHFRENFPAHLFMTFHTDASLSPNYPALFLLILHNTHHHLMLQHMLTYGPASAPSPPFRCRWLAWICWPNSLQDSCSCSHPNPQCSRESNKTIQEWLQGSVQTYLDGEGIFGRLVRNIES